MTPKRLCHNMAIRRETRVFLFMTLQEVQRDGPLGVRHQNCRDGGP